MKGKGPGYRRRVSVAGVDNSLTLKTQSERCPEQQGSSHLLVIPTRRSESCACQVLQKELGKPAFLQLVEVLGRITEVSESFLFLFGQQFHVEVLHGLDPVLIDFDG